MMAKTSSANEHGMWLLSVGNDYSILFFFFQAEDGIRDLTVTGVQTCALPICFLVAAYEHILEMNTSADVLTYDEEGKAHNLIGDKIGDKRLHAFLKSHTIDRKSVV